MTCTTFSNIMRCVCCVWSWLCAAAAAAAAAAADTDGFRMDGRRWKVDWASYEDFKMW